MRSLVVNGASYSDQLEITAPIDGLSPFPLEPLPAHIVMPSVGFELNCWLRLKEPR